MRGSVVARVRPFCAILAVVLFLCGCSRSSHNAARPSPSDTARIVTLVPSFADDLYAIGAGDRLVAVSAFTNNYQARALPRVADATSVDDEAIVALRPSVVIGIPAQSRFVEPLRRAGIAVVLLPDDTFDRIFTNLRIMGALTGRRRQAEATVRRLGSETREIQLGTVKFVRRPSVFVVLGAAPIWTAGSGSYITKLIALAGGENAASNLAQAYGVYSAEALLRVQPEILVTDPAAHLEALRDREPWRSLRAVRLHNVYAVNPEIIERPGPGYNAGIRWLARHIAPLAQRSPQ